MSRACSPGARPTTGPLAAPARFAVGDARAHQGDEPDDPYAPAPLCPRQARRRRGRARRLRLSRCQCAWRRRGSALALYGAFSARASFGARAPTRNSRSRSTPWSLILTAPEADRLRRALAGGGVRARRHAQSSAGLFDLERMDEGARRRDRARGPESGHDAYFDAWLAALEKLLIAKGVAAAARNCDDLADAGARPPPRRRTASRSCSTENCVEGGTRRPPRL